MNLDNVRTPQLSDRIGRVKLDSAHNTYLRDSQQREVKLDSVQNHQLGDKSAV